MASHNNRGFFSFVFLLYLSGLALAFSHLPNHHQGRVEHAPWQKRNNISQVDLVQAQALVDAAVRQQSIYNAYRVVNPRRNTYVSRHSAQAEALKKRKRDGEPTPPTRSAALRSAAALVAEHHAAQQQDNGTLHKTYAQPNHIKGFHSSGSNKVNTRAAEYWVAGITHSGHAPMGADDSYLVFRDVTDPRFAGGAKGDGVTDDTAAINAAIAYGNNCGSGCMSSSTKGTLIYFPPGTYLISTPIEAYYYSQLVGDPNNVPRITTTTNFIGLGAIESDVYIPGGNSNEWYIEQSNFYRQVRNFIIDVRATTTAKVAGLHWQVAQATSLTNVYIYASQTAGNSQMGIFTENGSGGFMSDVLISGGQYGIYGGNQQYTVRDFDITGQTTSCICLLWDWGWTWSGLFLTASPVGVTLINPDDPTGQQAGSIYIMDSVFYDVTTAIKVNSPKSTILDSSIITLDNIGVYRDVQSLISFSDGDEIPPSSNIEFIVIGNVEDVGVVDGNYAVNVGLPAPNLLGQYSPVYYRTSYFVKSRPQYQDIDLGSIINVKDHGAKGDGVSDDTVAIKAALALATKSNLIYFPAGSYLVTSTITIPPQTRMTGEVWSQLVALGHYFANVSSPQPMVRVGNPGDVGTVEISDMLFTSVGALPGLILMEWNVQAESPGSVGIWDAHFRVGGAYGTKLQVQQCPNVPSIPAGCVAASMMLHITPESNGYFEKTDSLTIDIESLSRPLLGAL